MSREYEHAAASLRQLMTAYEVSASELSARTGIDVATIRAVVSGRQKNISTRNMVLFARFFEKKLDELIDSFA